MAPDKNTHGLKAAIEKERANHGLHGVGEDGAFAPKATSVFSAAQEQVPAQTHRCGDIGDVLAGHQLGAASSHLALLPLGMEQKHRFSDDQAEYCVTQEFETLI